MSHFATADLVDTGYFSRQMIRLQALAERLGAPLCLTNSPTTVSRPEARGAWNRPGVMLYGSDPLEHACAESRRLAPVMTLRPPERRGSPAGAGSRRGHRASAWWPAATATATTATPWMARRCWWRADARPWPARSPWT